MKGCCVWSNLKRLRKVSHGRKWLLIEALTALAIARIAMACLPFRRIAAWLGTPGSVSLPTASPEDTRIAENVGWAIGALGPRVPWDGRCLAQAVAATAMLRRRGLEGTVSIGVRSGTSGGFDAHAWLRIGNCIVTGASGYQEFKVCTTFARKRR